MYCSYPISISLLHFLKSVWRAKCAISTMHYNTSKALQPHNMLQWGVPVFQHMVEPVTEAKEGKIFLMSYIHETIGWKQDSSLSLFPCSEFFLAWWAWSFFVGFLWGVCRVSGATSCCWGQGILPFHCSMPWSKTNSCHHCPWCWISLVLGELFEIKLSL